MFDESNSVGDAVERLNRDDPDFNLIDLYSVSSDGELAELAAALRAHPNVVHTVILGFQELTDETGVKLAGYVAASSTLRTLLLNDNLLGEATYLAMAAALRVNTSLRALHMQNNLPVDRSRVDAAFVDAMRLNPHRHRSWSRWQLYTDHDEVSRDIDYQRLQHVADQLGHPTLQSCSLFLLE